MAPCDKTNLGNNQTSKKQAIMIKKARYIYGNDIYKTIESSVSGQQSIPITYWDLWILILLVEEYKSRFNALIKRLKQIGRGDHYILNNSEAIVNHVRLLEKLVKVNSIDIENIIFNDDPDFLKKQKIKAKNKVIKMKFGEEEKSRWMIETPDYLRRRRALYGYWEKFPINPLSYSSVIHAWFKKKSGYSESQTLGLVDRLNNRINKLVKKASNKERIAIYRAGLSVLLEHIDWIDDSYGQYAMFYSELFAAYIELDRIPFLLENTFFLDLLEFIIQEDYGMLDQGLTDFFKRLTTTEVPIVEGILANEAMQLKKLELEYSYKKTSKLLRMLRQENIKIK